MIQAVHPGSDPDTDFRPIQDPGSRGKKCTGSRIRSTGFINVRGNKTNDDQNFMLNWFILPFSFIPVDICGPENTDQLHEVSWFSVELLAHLLHRLHLSVALAAVLMSAKMFITNKNKKFNPCSNSVADPDPGLGAFLTPGSGILDGRKSASGSGMNNPDHIF